MTHQTTTSGTRAIALSRDRAADFGRYGAWWLLASLTLLLSACSPSAKGSSTSEATTATPATWTVIGIDRSGSYSFLEPGRQMALAAVRDARPGDTIVVRWVSDNSYRNAEFALRFTAPVTETQDCPNRYDTTCRRKNLEAKLAEQEARERAFTQIRDLQVAAASKTDIVGFLLAAAEVLAAAPPEADRQVWLATDLLDNVQHYRLPVDLAGAKVFVRGLQNDDAEKSVSLRAEWQDRLTRFGASSVRFESAEVAP